MYCDKLGISIIANNIVSGSNAEILAYGFSGKRLYHFSSRYLSPCATKIAEGNIKNTTAFGLKPVIITVNIKSNDAIELREAKKPFVVENNPISASASIGKLMSGAKNTLSVCPRHKNTGVNPDQILGKKLLPLKSFANRSSIIVFG